MLKVESFSAGPLANNIYLIYDVETTSAVVIDPSINSGQALLRMRELEQEGIHLQAIWNTHGHFDHVYDNAQWKSAFRVPVFMHRDDEFWLERLADQAAWFGLPKVEAVTPDVWIDVSQTLRIGGYEATVLHTPGHSPGSVSFFFAEAAEQPFCVSGDVLFKGSAGRTDLPGCSASQLRASLEKLRGLPAATLILPGHGEATTMSEEVATNPFYRHIQFVEES